MYVWPVRTVLNFLYEIHIFMRPSGSMQKMEDRGDGKNYAWITCPKNQHNQIIKSKDSDAPDISMV